MNGRAIFFWSVIICVFCSSHYVFASGVQSDEYIYDIGVEFFDITYKEPGLMSSTGQMLGVYATYTYHRDIMLQFEGRFAYSNQITYEGHLSDGAPLRKTGIEDYIAEVRSLGGYDFYNKILSTRITPFVGLGYRYLLDEMSDVSQFGYDRESNYFYSPIGISFSKKLQNHWKVDFTMEYDIFWRGFQVSHFSNLDNDYNNLKQNQDSGYGLRSSIRLQYKQLAIEPFVRYWNIEESDIAILTLYGMPTGAMYREPDNNTTEIGLKALWRF